MMRIKFIAGILSVFLLVACTSSNGQNDAGVAPTWTPIKSIPASTSIPPANQLTEMLLLVERLSHVSLTDNTLAGYAYRSFLQMPVGMTWGPDNMLYVADWTGQHVVRVSKDGTMDDLPFWKRVEELQYDGPRDVEFDSKGNLYVNNHDYIYLVDPAGNVTRLTGIKAAPIGSIAISSADELYYTDRDPDGGAIRKWHDGTSDTVADNLPFAQNMVFGLDGALYLTQFGQRHILKVDVRTGSVSTFMEDACGNEPCFLAVDKEGDIWARGFLSLRQFSPDGIEKNFIVDGQTYPGGSFGWHTSAGIAFDDEGGLWIGSYNSRLHRLAPTMLGQPDPEYTLQVISSGFEASDLDVGLNNEIYASEWNTNQILRIDPDGKLDTVLDHGIDGRTALAVDNNGVVYVGLPTSEIVRIEADGTAKHYANIDTERMTFAADGALYAVAGKWGETHSIVRVTGVDEFTVIATQLAGIELGKGPSHISPALDKGLYLYSGWTCDLFFMDFNGQGRLIANLKQLGCYGPTLMAASPVTGVIYIVPHGPYALFRVTPDGQYTQIASRIFGDPWGIVASRDGRWLYVAESGAVDKIPLSPITP